MSVGAVIALMMAVVGVGFVPAALGAFLGTNGKIVFVSDRDGDNEIFTMNPDGTAQTNITNNSFTEFEPAWSADGTRIAFVSNRDGNNEIYTMDANGGSVVRVTNTATSERNPAWHPDGARILYTSLRSGDLEISSRRPRAEPRRN
ncbi:MAG: hypothetical protein LC733_07770 [Actinobacteria bacterium]|nr:hypothetical protein [Actinomycetota bacterium]